MKTLRTSALKPLIALAFAVSFAAEASAALGDATPDGMSPQVPAAAAAGEKVAQGGCSAAAAQAAAQTGGQVLSVVASQQNGQPVCVVTVLIPGHDGDRPRRTTVTIPQ